MEKLVISKEDKILIVAPHPDDECIGTGGVLSLYSNQCTVWVLSDGAHGTKGDNNVSDRRKSEFLREMSEVQPFDYRLFDEEDGTLQQRIDMLEKVDLSGYTKIFVTNENDIHPDHRAAYNIVKNALIKQNIKGVQLFQYEISEPLHVITHVLDISANITKKESMIKCHVSQMELYDYVGMALSLNKYRATQSGMPCAYIEGYKLADIYDNNPAYDLQLHLEQRVVQQNKRVHLLSSWMDVINKGKSINDYLKQNEIKHVVIYGCGDTGKKLFSQIENCKVADVECFIDKKLFGTEYNGKKIYSIETLKHENKNGKYIVIISVVSDIEEIKEKLMKYGWDNVVSIQQIIDELSSLF